MREVNSVKDELPDKFIVRTTVQINGRQDEVMYWTLLGSTTSVEEAYVFTWETIPDLCKSSLRASYVDIIAVE